MDKKILDISLKEQKDILQTLALKLGKSAQILEKDIWIYWTLGKLFSMLGALQMAFKGETYLKITITFPVLKFFLVKLHYSLINLQPLHIAPSKCKK